MIKLYLFIAINSFTAIGLYSSMGNTTYTRVNVNWLGRRVVMGKEPLNRRGVLMAFKYNGFVIYKRVLKMVFVILLISLILESKVPKKYKSIVVKTKHSAFIILMILLWLFFGVIKTAGATIGIIYFYRLTRKDK
jgi:hypothetical protein